MVYQKKKTNVISKAELTKYLINGYSILNGANI